MKIINLSKIGILTLAVGTITLGSCKKKGCTDPLANNYNEKAKKDDGSCTFDEIVVETEERVSGTITTNTVWTSDMVYILDGKVVIDGGATLTIEAGTIIKGEEGTGTNASALIIARNAKINAAGTSTSPIIFTSILDNIEIGQTSGTNLDENDRGKWGGLIVLGNAKVSTADGDTEGQIEGIPATETYGTYGGSDDADNSGTLSYISIRHGGALIGAGNEINGLTLGGVGTGTTISNIEVLANVDDGIEFFGGSVNVSNIVISYQGDDGIDIDQNYSGTVNNFMVVHGVDTDEALEIDGPEGSTYTTGSFTLSNGTIKSADGIGSGSDMKSGAQGNLTNISWEGYSSNSIKFRASFSDTVNCTDKADAYLNLTTSALNVTTCDIVGAATIADQVDVYTKSYVDSGNDICTGPLETTAESTVGATIVGSATVGATSSSFTWTWSAVNGKL